MCVSLWYDVFWRNIDERTIQMRGSYGELFVYSLRKFGILSVGIYRFRDMSCSIAINPYAKRYVITNPPEDFRLLPTDKASYNSCYVSSNNIRSRSAYSSIDHISFSTSDL